MWAAFETACAFAQMAVAAHSAGVPPREPVNLLALCDAFTSCRDSSAVLTPQKYERVLLLFAIATVRTPFENYLERVTMGVMNLDRHTTCSLVRNAGNDDERSAIETALCARTRSAPRSVAAALDAGAAVTGR